MSKKIIQSVLVCCLLLSFNITKGQQTFVKSINVRGAFSSMKADSNYYCNSGWGSGFVKFDQQNNVISERAYKGYDINGFYIRDDFMYSIKEDNQNCFLLTGQTNNWINDTSAWNYPYTNNSNFVIKVNANGDTIWSMLYERGGRLGFCLANDSNYIFTGGFGGHIFKVNKNTGDTLWSQRYRYDLNAQYTWSCQFNGGIVNNGSGYTTTGYIFPPNTLRAQLLLAKLDYDGNLLWCKSYGDTSFNNNWGMTMTHDSGYVIIGQSAKDFADTYPWTNYMLIRTDANGDTLWCRTYDYNNGVDVPYAIVETSDYGFAVVGQSSQKDSVGNWENYSMMIKVDSMGNVVWGNLYNPGFPNNLSKIGNGFLFTDGMVHQTDSNGTDCTSQPITVSMHYPVMTVTDSMPYLDTLPQSLQFYYYFHPPLQYDTIVASITDYCINTGVAEQTVKQNELSVYPNPVLNKLSVSIPISIGTQLSNNAVLTVTVYDVMGKQKRQQQFATNEGKLSLDVSGLASGIYFLQVQQKCKVYNAKFVKE